MNANTIEPDVRPQESCISSCPVCRGISSLWGALAVATVLRFVALGHKMLWCDELATLQRLGLGFAEHVRAMRGNHPLYELLLRLWASPESSDVWIRLPSAALGVLAVWMTWLLVRGIGRKEANLAAWLMALSPLHVMYSRIARAYSLAPTLAIASCLALVWALKRRKALPLVAYVIATTLMIYSNLVAGSLWVAQGVFILWFYGRRWRRLGPWILAHVAVGLLLLPWMLTNVQGAVGFGTGTAYTAQQLGIVAKACYIPLTFCLGETVSPLNFGVAITAFLGFGATMAAGVGFVLRRRSRLSMFLLMQVVVALAIALYFAATAPKHLNILLPAWSGLLAVGLWRLRPAWLRWPCMAVILFVTLISLLNYFSNREFADADMVTPWREMVSAVEESEQPTDALIIGYEMDHGAYDMFRRYYDGPLDAEYLDFDAWQSHLAGALQRSSVLWLLFHDGDPHGDLEAWLDKNALRYKMTPFQVEEETLRRIREQGLFGRGGDYQRPLYRLYRIENTPDSFIEKAEAGSANPEE